jgi:hypothetical protein
MEMEPLREKLLRRSLDSTFSDADNSDEDDILVHGSDDTPSASDRTLLDEEDEREKLLTKKRNKVLIGSQKHGRRKSRESYMEDGTLEMNDKPKRLKVRQIHPTPDMRILTYSVEETTLCFCS